MRHHRPVRLFLFSLVGGVIGTWSGVLLYWLLGTLGAWLFPSPGCSGLPCDSDFAIFIGAGVVGGACGAAIGYAIPQWLMHRPLQTQVLILYMLVGSVLWFGLGLLIFFMSIMSGFADRFGWEGAEAIFVTILGGVIGSICGWITTRSHAKGEGSANAQINAIDPPVQTEYSHD